MDPVAIGHAIGECAAAAVAAFGVFGAGHQVGKRRRPEPLAAPTSDLSRDLEELRRSFRTLSEAQDRLSQAQHTELVDCRGHVARLEADNRELHGRLDGQREELDTFRAFVSSLNVQLPRKPGEERRHRRGSD